MVTPSSTGSTVPPGSTRYSAESCGVVVGHAPKNDRGGRRRRRSFEWRSSRRPRAEQPNPEGHASRARRCRCRGRLSTRPVGRRSARRPRGGRRVARAPRLGLAGRGLEAGAGEDVHELQSAVNEARALGQLVPAGVPGRYFPSHRVAALGAVAALRRGCMKVAPQTSSIGSSSPTACREGRAHRHPAVETAREGERKNAGGGTDPDVAVGSRMTLPGSPDE